MQKLDLKRRKLMCIIRCKQQKSIIIQNTESKNPAFVVCLMK